MKNFLAAFMTVLIGLLCACSGDSGKKQTGAISNLDQLNNHCYTIGLLSAEKAVQDTVNQKFPDAKKMLISSPETGIRALRKGTLDALIADRATLEYWTEGKMDVCFVPGVLTRNHDMILAKDSLVNRQLIDKINEFIRQYQDDGTCSQMLHYWKNARKSPELPPINPTEHSMGARKVGVFLNNAPFCFLDRQGKPTGFDVEFLSRLSKHLNINLNLIIVDPMQMGEALRNGEIDLGITESDTRENQKIPLLSTHVWRELPVCALIRKNDLGPIQFSSAIQLDDPMFVVGGELDTNSIKAGERVLTNAEFRHFQSIMDAYTALESGEIHAVVYDRPPLDYLAMKNKNLAVLNDSLDVGHIAVGAPFKNKALVEKVNIFIRQYRADGTCREMYRRWVQTPNPKMPEFPPVKSPRGKLIIGTECLNPPMNFKNTDGILSGFDIELIHRLAVFLNTEVEIRIMPYDELFPAVSKGELDLAVASMDVSPFWKKSMLFSEEYMDCPVAVMIRASQFSMAANDLQKESGEEMTARNEPFSSPTAKNDIRN